MAMKCAMCKITSDKEDIKFQFVSQTKKFSMCNRCYTKFLSYGELVTQAEIKAIESEEKTRREREELKQ